MPNHQFHSHCARCTHAHLGIQLLSSLGLGSGSPGLSTSSSTSASGGSGGCTVTGWCGGCDSGSERLELGGVEGDFNLHGSFCWVKRGIGSVGFEDREWSERE
jgi:hypothetical protein